MWHLADAFFMTQSFDSYKQKDRNQGKEREGERKALTKCSVLLGSSLVFPTYPSLRGGLVWYMLPMYLGIEFLWSFGLVRFYDAQSFTPCLQ